MYGLKKLLTNCGVDVVREIEVNNQNLEVLESFLDDDKLIIINGEGTFHDDQYYARLILNKVEKYADRVLLLNSQFRNMGVKYIDIVKKFMLVQVRTMYDYNYCEKKGLMNLFYCPDMLFYSGLGHLPSVENGEKGVVFTDSHVSSSTKEIYSCYSRYSKPKKWLNLHYKHFGGGDSIVKNSMLFLASKINARKYGYRFANKKGMLHLSETVNVLENAKCVVTGRYHAACLAIHFNIPLLYSYSNTSKVRDLCNDFDFGVELDPTERVEKSIERAIGKRNQNTRVCLMGRFYSDLRCNIETVIG